MGKIKELVEPTEAEIWANTRLRIPSNWRSLTWIELKEAKK